jgi:hypothetical protein
VDKKQNEQSNALDLLRAYLVDDKLNSRQAMIIKRNKNKGTPTLRSLQKS